MQIALATDNSHLFEVATKIGLNDVNFVIDTGASIIILPQKMALGLHLNPTLVKLSAANRRDIECFGETLVVIGIPSLRHSYTYTVVVADTANPS